MTVSDNKQKHYGYFEREHFSSPIFKYRTYHENKLHERQHKNFLKQDSLHKDGIDIIQWYLPPAENTGAIISNKVNF